MAEPVVVNASPLIYLARGGCFELLQVASAQNLVPASVDRSFGDAVKTILPSRQWAKRHGFKQLPIRAFLRSSKHGISAPVSRLATRGRPLDEIFA